MNVYGMSRRQSQRLWMVGLLVCFIPFAGVGGLATYQLNAELKLRANPAETCASVSGARTMKEDGKLSYELKYTFTPIAGEVMVAEKWQSLGAAAWQGALDRGCVAVVYEREDAGSLELPFGVLLVLTTMPGCSSMKTRSMC